MITAIKEHAAKHALIYVIAIGMGLQGLGNSFFDNFWSVEPSDMARLGWWQVVALVMKSLSGAIGIVIGYLLDKPKPKADAPPAPETPFAPVPAPSAPFDKLPTQS